MVTDEQVEAGARAVQELRYPGSRWPKRPSDTIDDRNGVYPVTWDFAEQCRAVSRAVLNAQENTDG